MPILNLLRSKRGQSLVEFTLAAPLFFAAFYAIVEFSHLFYVRVTVQHALDEAGRYMSIGQGQSATDPGARMAAVKSAFCSNLIATGLSCPALGSPQFSVNPPSGGAPGDVVTVTTTFTKSFFSGALRFIDPVFPTGVTMTLSTTYQNEPYVVVPVGGGAP
jgi:Flp pilus assembly protein TadG